MIVWEGGWKEILEQGKDTQVVEDGFLQQELPAFKVFSCENRDELGAQRQVILFPLAGVMTGPETACPAY